MFIPFEVEHEPHNAQRQPWLVYALLTAYILVFGYTGITASEATRTDLFYRLGLVRFEYHWWAFLTCTFLHSGILHLVFNCL